MTKIRIDVFEAGKPAATIVVPMWVMAVASKLLPKIAGTRLQDHIDIDQVVALVKDPQAKGVFLEIVDHKQDERIVISVIENDTAAVQ